MKLNVVFNCSLYTIGLTALLIACYQGHPRVVDTLLRHGVDPTALDSNQNTALDAAWLTGRMEVVQIFIKHKLVSRTDDSTHLMSAVLSGNLGLVKLIVKAGQVNHLNASFDGDDSPLIRAASHGHADIVSFLIDNGADPNFRTAEKRTTALTAACMSGQLEIVKLLIKSGADAKVLTKDSLNALQCAAVGGQCNVMKFLVESGANWQQTTGDDDSSLLHLACHEGSEHPVDSCQYLIELGLDVNVRDAFGNTPLTLVTTSGNDNVKLTKFLIHCGADLTAASDTGLTAVIGAASAGQLETLKLLVQNGALVNDCHTNTDNHPFLQAVMSDRLEIVQYLCRNHHSNIDMKMTDGLSALMVAIMNEAHTVAEYLINAACDVNVVSDSGETALSITLQTDSPNADLVSLLIESGANMEHKTLDGRNTPLLIAVKNQNDSLAILLLDKGCNVNAADGTDATALFYAIRDQSQNLTVQLVSRGARQMVNQPLQLTALMVASTLDSGAVIIEYLLAQNGNAHARNTEGLTALMFATRAGRVDNVKALLAHRVNVNVRDNAGETALVKACVKGTATADTL